MSDPTGNALRSAQSSGGEFFEDIDACAESSPNAWETRVRELVKDWYGVAPTPDAETGDKSTPVQPDARESRLLALVELLNLEAHKAQASLDDPAPMLPEDAAVLSERAFAYGFCSFEILAALRGDA